MFWRMNILGRFCTIFDTGNNVLYLLFAFCFGDRFALGRKDIASGLLQLNLTGKKKRQI